MTKRSFEMWMGQVEEALESACGMNTAELPDCDYWEWWDAGVSPERAAKRAIDNAGGY